MASYKWRGLSWKGAPGDVWVAKTTFHGAEAIAIAVPITSGCDGTLKALSVEGERHLSFLKDCSINRHGFIFEELAGELCVIAVLPITLG